MEGSAIERWVRRHSPEERFLAGLALSDAAIGALLARLREKNPDAGAAEVRAEIRRLRDG